MSQKEYFDIIVCIPLEIELTEFYRVFPNIKDLTKNYLQRFVVETGQPNLSMLVVAQDEMGRSSSQRCVAAALEDFDVGIVVALGIAGGISDDLSLGSVCYSSTIIDVYDNAKVSDDEAGIDTEFAPNHLAINRDLTNAMNFLRSNPEQSQAYRDWQALCADNATTVLVTENVDSLLANFELEPISLNGALACGQVSDSKKYNDKLKKIDRKILAIETESGGSFEAAKQNGVALFTTVRGISDFAEGKKKLEKESKGAVRRIAAYNAATFLKAQLGNKYFSTVVLEGRSYRTEVDGRALSLKAPTDLPGVVQELSHQIDQKLRELSPEYKLAEQGYSLPIPRIKPLDFETTYASLHDGPAEIRDVLESINTIVVDIPRTYPDDGLAWVIAHSLIMNDIDRKQILPFVIDGRHIAPPKSGFASQAGVSLDFVSARPDDSLPVFIIDNPPLNSKTRISYLIEECQRHSGKYIFIVRGELDTFAATTLTDEMNVEPFGLCPISFSGIAHFVQKYCQLPQKESDVIALRLTETFERFGLLAHPTYFAGIPKEVLIALLQANKRSELIQLAVDGFLTLLVAEDVAAVALSRTTRERFLREFVLETRIKGNRLTSAECVKFVADFAEMYGYEINPIEFIQNFVTHGILHYYNDEIYFSLPFIESYLLASELHGKPELAEIYFDIDKVNFDFAAFDLYAEMGPSSKIIEAVLSKLSALADEWRGESANSILSSESSPKILAKPDALSKVQKRIDTAIRNVRENKSNTERKQRMIDLAEDVRESISRQRKQRSKQNAEGVQNEAEFSELTRQWVIGVILLGSGAERVFASSKIDMVESLAEVGSIIVDRWTRRNSEVDFDAIRASLFDEKISEKLEFESDSEREEFHQFFINLTDVLEHNLMSEPLRRVLGFLGEQARHSVLALSLDKSKTPEIVANVIRTAWLSDIDVKRGIGDLSEALRDASAAPLLRIGLATHLMSQVFWRHANKDKQMALLQAANDAIRPLKLSYNTGQLKRDIKQGRLSPPDGPLTASKSEGGPPAERSKPPRKD